MSLPGQNVAPAVQTMMWCVPTLVGNLHFNKQIITGDKPRAVAMAARDDPEAAVVAIRVVEGDHHVGQAVAVAADVAPVGRVLVPAEARALARPLQVDLVGPERDGRLQGCTT